MRRCIFIKKNYEIMYGFVCMDFFIIVYNIVVGLFYVFSYVFID